MEENNPTTTSQLNIGNENKVKTEEKKNPEPINREHPNVPVISAIPTTPSRSNAYFPRKS